MKGSGRLYVFRRVVCIKPVTLNKEITYFLVNVGTDKHKCARAHVFVVAFVLVISLLVFVWAVSRLIFQAVSALGQVIDTLK